MTKGCVRRNETANLIENFILKSVMETLADNFSDLSDKEGKISLIFKKIDRIAMFCITFII